MSMQLNGHHVPVSMATPHQAISSTASAISSIHKPLASNTGPTESSIGARVIRGVQRPIYNDAGGDRKSLQDTNASQDAHRAQQTQQQHPPMRVPLQSLVESELNRQTQTGNRRYVGKPVATPVQHDKDEIPSVLQQSNDAYSQMTTSKIVPITPTSHTRTTALPPLSRVVLPLLPQPPQPSNTRRRAATTPRRRSTQPVEIGGGMLALRGGLVPLGVDKVMDEPKKQTGPHRGRDDSPSAPAIAADVEDSDFSDDPFVRSASGQDPFAFAFGPPLRNRVSDSDSEERPLQAKSKTRHERKIQQEVSKPSTTAASESLSHNLTDSLGQSKSRARKALEVGLETAEKEDDLFEEKMLQIDIRSKSRTAHQAKKKPSPQSLAEQNASTEKVSANVQSAADVVSPATPPQLEMPEPIEDVTRDAKPSTGESASTIVTRKPIRKAVSKVKRGVRGRKKATKVQADTKTQQRSVDQQQREQPQIPKTQPLGFVPTSSLPHFAQGPQIIPAHSVILLNGFADAEAQLRNQGWMMHRPYRHISTRGRRSTAQNLRRERREFEEYDEGDSGYDDDVEGYDSVEMTDESSSSHSSADIDPRSRGRYSSRMSSLSRSRSRTRSRSRGQVDASSRHRKKRAKNQAPDDRSSERHSNKAWEKRRSRYQLEELLTTDESSMSASDSSSSSSATVVPQRSSHRKVKPHGHEDHRRREPKAASKVRRRKTSSKVVRDQHESRSDSESQLEQAHVIQPHVKMQHAEAELDERVALRAAQRALARRRALEQLALNLSTNAEDAIQEDLRTRSPDQARRQVRSGTPSHVHHVKNRDELASGVFETLQRDRMAEQRLWECLNEPSDEEHQRREVPYSSSPAREPRLLSALPGLDESLKFSSHHREQPDFSPMVDMKTSIFQDESAMEIYDPSQSMPIQPQPPQRSKGEKAKPRKHERSKPSNAAETMFNADLSSQSHTSQRSFAHEEKQHTSYEDSTFSANQMGSNYSHEVSDITTIDSYRETELGGDFMSADSRLGSQVEPQNDLRRTYVYSVFERDPKTGQVVQKQLLQRLGPPPSVTDQQQLAKLAATAGKSSLKNAVLKTINVPYDRSHNRDSSATTSKSVSKGGYNMEVTSAEKQSTSKKTQESKLQHSEVRSVDLMPPKSRSSKSKSTELPIPKVELDVPSATKPAKVLRPTAPTRSTEPKLAEAIGRTVHAKSTSEATSLKPLPRVPGIPKRPMGQPTRIPFQPIADANRVNQL